MADVLLRYSRTDADAVARLSEALKAADLTVAERTGDAWPDSQDPAPAEGIDTAACIVVLWSARAAAAPDASQALINAALSAWSTERLVLAVLDGAPLPAGLRDLSAVDLSTREAGFEEAIRRAKLLVDKRQRSEAAGMPPPSKAGPVQPAPSAPKGARPRLHLILAAVAVLTIALVVGFWPSPEKVGDLPKGSPPTYAQMELSPLLLGGAAVLVVIGLIRFLRSWFAEKARAASRDGSRPAPAAAQPADAARPDQGAPGIPQIFISYSRQDTDFVDRIIGLIEEAGYTVWIDREAGGHGTQRYAAPIVRAIKSARVVALMCSRNAFASDHVVREIYVAGDFRKPFLAFQLDETQFPDDLIYFLSGFPRIPADPVEPEQLRQEIKRYVS